MPSSARLVEWDPDKKKKTTEKTITDKRIGTTKYSESIEGSIWLGCKVPFWAKPKLI